MGFQFCHTRLLGFFPVPFHANFDEVNLRFYVRRKEGGEDRRGVVFIAEIVPRRAIATTARVSYGENYRYCPMRHRIETRAQSERAEYQWQLGISGAASQLRPPGIPTRPPEGSLEQFITEHYWGVQRSRRRPKHTALRGLLLFVKFVKL